MEYFDFNDKEITEAEYKSRLSGGKRFTQRGNRLRQMPPAQEAARDKEEAEYKAKNPQTLDAFKAKKIDRVSQKMSMKYSKFVDKHHQKKTRREQSGKSYTIPNEIIVYADALESFFDNLKDEVNSCTTQEQCELVRVGHNDHPNFPDESGVRNL